MPGTNKAVEEVQKSEGTTMEHVHGLGPKIEVSALLSFCSQMEDVLGEQDVARCVGASGPGPGNR